MRCDKVGKQREGWLRLPQARSTWKIITTKASAEKQVEFALFLSRRRRLALALALHF